ncbi:MAG: sigma-70 family RNA polymerase sigma factor [Solirubrobacterales bacterium]
MNRATSPGGLAERTAPDDAARKRAAVELIRRHEATLRRTARRYSLCGEDAEDAFQRAFEILLTKAPTDDSRELIRWMQTVTKHEALAVRRHRERIMNTPRTARPGEEPGPDWVQLIPSERDGPADQVERRERIARSREALQALKPQELRALTLLAEGYSYAEIGQLTGWTRTKINRCLAEGRARFRALVASSEEGGRCEELGPALSAYCDGEAGPAEAGELREHLRACPHCRATVRAYRAAPRAAAALAPVPPVAGLAERLHGAAERLHSGLASAQSRLPGRSGAAEAATQMAASGGGRGAGLALVAKIVAACVGTAGGAAACVAVGVLPAPGELGPAQQRAPTIERSADPVKREALAPPPEAVAPEPAAPAPPQPEPPAAPAPETTPPPAPAPPPQAVEFSPEASAPASSSGASSSPPPPPGGGSGEPPAGGAAGAGEFGP